MAALNLSPSSSSTSIYRVKPWFHSRPSSKLLRVSLRSVKNGISENEARDDLGVWPWSTSIQGQRSKVSSRDSLSLSFKAQLFGFAFYGPEVKRALAFASRPADLESQLWPRNPAFSRFSRQPLAIMSERASVYCNNGLSYVNDWLVLNGITGFMLPELRFIIYHWIFFTSQSKICCNVLWNMLFSRT